MAKRIQISDEMLEQARKDFEKQIQNLRATDGVLKFEANIGEVDEKATVFFTADAFLKMRSLVDGFDSEVGWHGISERLNGNMFLIKDILVYPQHVTGVTVTTEDTEISDWSFDIGDAINEMRMQGHSHVNMGVSPSSTDLELYRKYLSGLPEDDYYIFLITNKKGDVFWKIYDLGNNILFETKDVSWNVIFNDGKETLGNFMGDARDLVKKKTYSTAFSSKKEDTKKSVLDDKPKKYSKSFYDSEWYSGYGYDI